MSSSVWSQSTTGPQHSNAPLNFCTDNQATCAWPYKVNVSDGTLTCANGVCDLDVSGTPTTPGGSSGQVQYNNAGAFGGFGNWDGTILTIPQLILNGSAAGSTKWYESATGGGTNYVSFRAADSLGVDTTWILPTADSSGCWKSDGSGNLSIGACGSGTVTSVSVSTANGFSGSVSNPTTTPAITLNQINWSAVTALEPTANVNWSSGSGYSSGLVWTATSGTGANWQSSPTPTTLNLPYLKYSNTQTSGTGGGTSTAGSFQPFFLNTEDFDTAGIGSLSSNQVTLPAGTYQVRSIGMLNGNVAIYASTRLYNITDSAVLLLGTTAEVIPTGTALYTNVVGQFTLSGTKALELQYRVSTGYATFGQGINGSFQAEVYTQLEFWKIG